MTNYKLKNNKNLAFSIYNSAFIAAAGFTLIELLVVISIIGILIGLSIFGLQGAREASRDARRKSDLELIRSGVEIYKADCNKYPATLSSSLVGDNTSTSCSSANTYISTVPTDPSTAGPYKYVGTTTTYILCATLEKAPNPLMDTTGCGFGYNYKVTNP